MSFFRKNGYGILTCIIIAAVSTVLSGLKPGGFSFDIIGAPVFAILTGMVVTLIIPGFAASEALSSGIKFTSKKILQWAVIILGFSLNLGTIVSVGAKCLPVIIATISASLIVAFVMRKLLKMDSKVATLIGVGSSICGGSAIAATAPVIEADDTEVAQAISVVFLFNVLAALIFPTLGHAIGFGSEGFAVFAGTAVNDTSSVTACASIAESIYGVDGILSAAVTVKLTRTLAIIPITLVLALYKTFKSGKSDEKTGEKDGSYSIKSIFPVFILYFILAALITTAVGAIGENIFTAFYFGTFVPIMKWLAKFFIAMAMSAIGLNTNIVSLIKKGGKPIIMGFTCWAAIIAVSIAVQLASGIFYSNIL